MRELATQRYDLPHEVEMANQATMTCACGRIAEHPLHHFLLPETASAERLITQKGT